MFAFSRIKGGSTPSRASLTVNDAIRQAESGEITVVDVREHSEVSMTGKAAPAIHIPLMLLSSHADPRHPEVKEELSTSKPVAVYCASGARSQSAMQMLKQMGYETVHNIGGFSHWVAAGGATSR